MKFILRIVTDGITIYLIYIINDSAMPFCFFLNNLASQSFFCALIS
jgi:hypothetical protein